MREFKIKLTDNAKYDILQVHDYIAYELYEPIAADKYFRGIYDAIRHLSLYGSSIAVSEREYLLYQFGPTVRNIIYKKMAIIFTIENNEIIIQKIIAASLIK